MKVLTVEQMKSAENEANMEGMSFIQMMENAGSGCAKYIKEVMKIESGNYTKATVLCGGGKNAGDGLVIARKLKHYGCDVNVIFFTERLKSRESVEMYNRANNLDINFVKYTSSTVEADREIINSDIIVDAIFGIGFEGNPDVYFENIFRKINSTKGTIFSVDVPSALPINPDECEYEYIQADFTLAIEALKPVHLMNVSKIGIVKVIEIGIPGYCFPHNVANVEIPGVEGIKSVLPVKSENAHKGNFGKAVIIAGSLEFQGAATLAANACVKSGAGLVRIICPSKIYCAVAPKVTEPIMLPVKTNAYGGISVDAIDEILDEIENADAVLIGCGMGNTPDTAEIVEAVIKNAECPVIVDADGINAISQNTDILNEANCKVILTPHPGEMTRLTGEPVDVTVSDRIMTALKFTENYDVTLALKGADTIVVQQGNYPVFINTTGNNGMATGGSGDVLAGIITALVAQGTQTYEAAAAGVFIHGYAGDSYARKFSRRGLTPTGLINELPEVLADFE